ncbi:MAG: hypothetical protein LBM27_05930, partial [Lactobacillaceae bacterium]|nr:hypothetical protein [Lactobacillaceae bacterium]
RSKEYDDFLDKWNSLPNTNTIVNENSYPAMAAADLVLTDGVSSLYEAQIFKKPIVYYERAGHTKFTQLGEKWMRGVHTVSKLDDLVPTIEKLLFGKNDLEAIEEENFKQLTKGFPTQAILDFIVKDLRKGKFNS